MCWPSSNTATYQYGRFDAVEGDLLGGPRNARPSPSEHMTGALGRLRRKWVLGQHAGWSSNVGYGGFQLELGLLR